jgi:S1/P1 Nuclease
MRRILLALVVLFPISSNAWAWGDEGHKVICEIAFRLSQPNTRAEIRKLIATDEQFNTFSASCVWPDHPRQRAIEHFVNLRRDSDGLHSETCPGAAACVVTAIKKDFEVLSSSNASQAEKLASLKFLVRRRSGWKQRPGERAMRPQFAFRLGYLPCTQGSGGRRG